MTCVPTPRPRQTGLNNARVAVALEPPAGRIFRPACPMISPSSFSTANIGASGSSRSFAAELAQPSILCGAAAAITSADGRFTMRISAMLMPIPETPTRMTVLAEAAGGLWGNTCQFFGWVPIISSHALMHSRRICCQSFTGSRSRTGY